MGFEKGNKLQAKSVASRKVNKQKRVEFIAYLLGEGFASYSEKLKKLDEGIELSPPEREYMDRVEKMADFAIGRISRRDVDIKSGGESLGEILKTVTDGIRNKSKGIDSPEIPE